MTNSVFQGRSFLAEKDFTRAELEYLIGLSAHLKDLKKRNIQHHYLAGKNIALLFEKTSTRTRAAFTTAAIDPVSYTHLDVYKRQLYFLSSYR